MAQQMNMQTVPTEVGGFPRWGEGKITGCSMLLARGGSGIALIEMLIDERRLDLDHPIPLRTVVSQHETLRACRMLVIDCLGQVDAFADGVSGLGRKWAMPAMVGTLVVFGCMARRAPASTNHLTYCKDFHVVNGTVGTQSTHP